MFFYLGDYHLILTQGLRHQGSAEVVSELTELLSQLRKEPEGPELFRMNDRANELLKLLPLQLLGGEHGGTSWHRSEIFVGPPQKMGIFQGNGNGESLEIFRGHFFRSIFRVSTPSNGVHHGDLMGP